MAHSLSTMPLHRQRSTCQYMEVTGGTTLLSSPTGSQPHATLCTQQLLVPWLTKMHELLCRQHGWPQPTPTVLTHMQQVCQPNTAPWTRCDSQASLAGMAWSSATGMQATPTPLNSV
jgi:hypothetical protein